MRTENFSGIFLLGLQDFPGQGTALVGMMDAHLRPKPYAFAKPERFAAFFRDVLPLALLPRHVFSAGEEIRFSVRIANYGKTDLEGVWSWMLDGEGIVLSGTGAFLRLPAGSLSAAEDVRIPPAGLRRPARCTLTLRYGESCNTYPLWIYPDEMPSCPPDVLECRALDRKARQVLASGG